MTWYAGHTRIVVLADLNRVDDRGDDPAWLATDVPKIALVQDWLVASAFPGAPAATPG